MERPVINVELLQRTLDYIESHPQKWHQGWWRILRKKDKGTIKCDTAMCFAGWAVTLDKPELPWAEPVRWEIMGYNSEHRASLVVAEPEDVTFVRDSDDFEVQLADPGDYGLDDSIDNAVSVAFRAQRILGLTKEERMELFAGHNDLDKLKEIVARLIAEQTARDDYLKERFEAPLMTQEVQA